MARQKKLLRLGPRFQKLDGLPAFDNIGVAGRGCDAVINLRNRVQIIIDENGIAAADVLPLGGFDLHRLVTG